MSDPVRGIAAMVAACTVWGLSAMFYKLIAHVPPLEVLSHRTLWSLAFFGLVLALQGRLAEIGRIFAHRRTLAVVAAAGLFISTNWFFFIFSIQIGQAVEASLGYYIFPLVSVMLGRLVLGERLSALKWLAVALAAGAVALLTWGLGVAPWVSLVLAGTFGMYGLMKRRVPAGPVVSVTTEVLLLAPLAALWLWGVHVLGWGGIVDRPGAWFGTNWRDSLLLAASGILTATPLILFSYASKRLSMASVGLVQYLNPTLQFLVATLVFAEPFTDWHAIAFPMIWVALGFYSLESLRQERSARRRAVSVATSGTTRM
ncbi:EamA family transporter RarD [Maritimibacter sp. 55A14]|uniref:EamA family transporter RarD n=1 Tax=Maritimibacter sp. 55A14 TaxID=2174844 RepID=UPI000D61BF8F|nr:EamA family transporter RarD [Maritimibacter sp. 55A14]PWE33908.1 EamA family transporter RarD [Maritimibacter sp. 55A14]